MAIILHVPEALRAKLGEDGARELVALLDRAVRGLRENVGETAAERLERRIAETKAGIKAEIAETKTGIIETGIIDRIGAAESRLVWKMLAFLAGQTGVLYLLLQRVDWEVGNSFSVVAKLCHAIIDRKHRL